MLEQISSKMRNPTWVIAIIALVFAMAGGAWAASKKLTGPQKREVEKIAKKFAGKPGAPGVQGPAGFKGDNGTNGINGKDGANGTNGKSVQVVEEGSTVCEPSGGVIYEVEGSGVETEVCNGANGQDAGFNYVFSTSTAATDPGAGKLALNNAVAGEATTLSISKTDNDANGLEAVIKGWITGPTVKGTLLMRKPGEPTTFAEYTIYGPNSATNPTDEGEFDNIVITFVAGNGSFANEDPVTISYLGGATAILPVGATESGTWSFSGTEAENGSGAKEQEGILAPISFPIPLKAGVPRERVFFPGDPGREEHCTASAGRPEVTSAEYEGQLKTTVCFYIEESNLLHRATFANVWKADFSDVGLTRSGGVLQFKATEPGLAYGVGGWAVEAH